ncbi:hypothetical protein KAR26_02285 [Candidatus Parcubacteria bacterium]|nr:hypothetical protein [Candidatus Parcubacteria bacterium]
MFQSISKKLPRKLDWSVIFLGFFSAYISFQICLGIIMGYFVARIFSGKQPGETGRIKSIIFHWGDYRLHLHHWFLGFAVVLLALVLDYSFFDYGKFSYSFLGGLIFQGIFCYCDWKRIIIKQKKHEK